ncbi:MAG: hypothetical protein RL701_1661 [Pseudomonadota bacterium]|jgi:hypothetical protein
MTRSRLQSSLRTSVFTGVLAAVSGVAFAQEQPAPSATQEPAPATPINPDLAPAELTPPQPDVVTTPAPTVAVTAEPDAQKETAPEAEPEDAPWYANFKIGGYVDAYGAIRSDKNSRPTFGGTPVPIGGYYSEAYTQANGFALAFAGLDATYSGDKFGATINLRFGPGMNRFFGSDVTSFGIQNITQAFVTYKPVDMLTFDLGQFGTIYGAEVLESWKNINYTRGALYYAMQPFWHTGLRANIALHESFAINAMVVNGVNNAFENNKTPSLGLQAVFKAGDMFAVSAGYLGALNPRDGNDPFGAFQNFFDVVATFKKDGFTLIANFDANLYKNKGSEDGQSFWGISVAPAYSFCNEFGVGLRFEHLRDSANQWGMSSNKAGDTADKAYLTTLTATLDIKPVPNVSALILRPEFRYEVANNYYFYNRDKELSKGFWTLVLGAVVTSL